MVIKPRFFVFCAVVFLFSLMFFEIVRIKTSKPKIVEKVVYKEVERIKEVKVTDSFKDNYVSPGEVLEWYEFLVSQCKKRDVDIKIMMAIIKGESNFNPKLVNPISGCTGLGQVEYNTYVWLKREYFPNEGTSFSDMKNPYHNIRYSVLRFSLAKKEFKGDKLRALHRYGGCASADKKTAYIKYIRKNYRELYGEYLKI